MKKILTLGVTAFRIMIIVTSLDKFPSIEKLSRLARILAATLKTPALRNKKKLIFFMRILLRLVTVSHFSIPEVTTIKIRII